MSYWHKDFFRGHTYSWQVNSFLNSIWFKNYQVSVTNWQSCKTDKLA